MGEETPACITRLRAARKGVDLWGLGATQWPSPDLELPHAQQRQFHRISEPNCRAVADGRACPDPGQSLNPQNAGCASLGAGAPTCPLSISANLCALVRFDRAVVEDATIFGFEGPLFSKHRPDCGGN